MKKPNFLIGRGALLVALICGIGSATSFATAAPVAVPATFSLSTECGSRNVPLHADYRVEACPGEKIEISAVIEGAQLAARRIYFFANIDFYGASKVNLELVITGYKQGEIVSHVDGYYLATSGLLQASVFVPAQVDKLGVHLQVLDGPPIFRIKSIALSKSATVFRSGEMSEASKAYLARAFEKIKSRYLFYDPSLFKEIEQKTLLNATGANDPLELAISLKEAVRLLGDWHSKYLTADEIKLLAPEPMQAAVPLQQDHHTVHGKMLEPDIGYVKLRGNAATTRDARAQYARQIRDALLNLFAQGAKRWIIDLREHNGGSVPPLIAGFRPLLGTAVAAFTVDRDGQRTSWSFGILGDPNDSEPYFSAADNTFPGDEVPVALLIGSRTASAGEALLAAFRQRPRTATFGAKTAGLTTSVHDLPWDDGSSLAISTSRFADRTGQAILGQFEPDFSIAETVDDAALGIDAPLEAARNWLSEYPHAQPVQTFH